MATVLVFAQLAQIVNHIIRGLLLRSPDIDILRIQDVGLSGEDDPIMLRWVAAEKRVLLTHDVETIPNYAYERIKSGLSIPDRGFL